MRRFITLVAAVAAVAMLPGSGAMAAPARTLDIVSDGITAVSKTWNGTTATGANITHFWTEDDAALPDKCGTTTTDYCDTTLIKVTNAVPVGKTKLVRTLTVTATEFSPIPGPIADFDIKIYESDANGTRGLYASGPFATAQPPDSDETASVSVTTLPNTPTKYYLVDVIYFTTVQGTFKGTARF